MNQSKTPQNYIIRISNILIIACFLCGTTVGANNFAKVDTTNQSSQQIFQKSTPAFNKTVIPLKDKNLSIELDKTIPVKEKNLAMELDKTISVKAENLAMELDKTVTSLKDINSKFNLDMKLIMLKEKDLQNEIDDSFFYGVDSDGDGLSDRYEIWRSRTDPSKMDTDNDKLTDGFEIHYEGANTALGGTNPLSPDTDKDGLTDREEIWGYHTDPRKADTDDDGINDRGELRICYTDPNKADTDNDGITDDDEVFVYHTNPHSGDTDEDGFGDSEELFELGTDLNDPYEPNAFFYFRAEYFPRGF